VTQASQDMRRSRRAELRLAHRQAFLAEEVAGLELRRELGQHRPQRRLRQDARKIQETVDAHPALYHDVQTYLRERIDEVLAGAAEPMVVRVDGADLTTLRKQADRVEERLSGIDGLDDLHVELVADVPEIEVRERLAPAERYGLKPGDIRRAAATLVSSEEVGDLFHGAARLRRARLEHPERPPQPERRSATCRSTRPAAARGAGAWPACACARRRTSIHRQDARGASTSPPTQRPQPERHRHDVRDKLETITFPTGYHAELMGEAVEQEGAPNRLLSSGSRRRSGSCCCCRRRSATCAWRCCSS
jgi:multidrug efflux pump subunit AcrB